METPVIYAGEEFFPLHKQHSDRTSLEAILVAILPVYTTAIFVTDALN